MEHTLLHAIQRDPADDTAWLALADWLEEQDDPRSQLVRLQQTLRGDLDDADREALEARARALLLQGVKPCVPVVVNSIGMPLAFVRPGAFWMGSPYEEEGRYLDEDPRHRVEMTRAYYLGVYAVTQAEYHRVMGANPSHFGAVPGVSTDRFPVDSVTWHDAAAFCDRLSRRPAEERAGRRYRLPTEAEWEYACRAGVSSRAPFHYGYSFTSHWGNFDGAHPYGTEQQGPNLQRPCPVGAYPPNAFGLHDMHGNLWEWCADWFDREYYSYSPGRDPTGPKYGDIRVMRGGSFYYLATSCRSAIRFGRGPDAAVNLDGFRVAMCIG